MSGRTIHLRDARPTDAGAVGAILSDFTHQTPWLPRLHSGAETLAFAGAMIDRRWIRVAERKGAVAGFLARDGARVHALYVRPVARGQGIGSALLAEAQAVAGVLELATFEANAGARRFYARHGFIETARSAGRENDEGLPDVSYRWQAAGRRCA